MRTAIEISKTPLTASVLRASELIVKSAASFDAWMEDLRRKIQMPTEMSKRSAIAGSAPCGRRSEAGKSAAEQNASPTRKDSLNSTKVRETLRRIPSPKQANPNASRMASRSSGTRQLTATVLQTKSPGTPPVQGKQHATETPDPAEARQRRERSECHVAASSSETPDSSLQIH